MTDKSLAVSKKEEIAAFSEVEYTGHDMGQSNVYPSIVNVLQSDKQFKAFPDNKASELVDNYGKLFIRTEHNVLGDLVDTLDGTIVKVERGWEAYNKEGKIEESGHSFLKGDMKQALEENYGETPKNMVKVLFSPYDFQTTSIKLDALNAKINNNEALVKSDYPFVIAVVKGDAFGSWIECEEEMNRIAAEEFGIPMYKVPIPAFKIKLSSEKREGERGDYYVLDFKVEENDPIEAKKFFTFLPVVKEVSMFYKVKDRIGHDESSEAEIIDRTFEGMDKEEVKEADVVDIDEIGEDLPF